MWALLCACLVLGIAPGGAGAAKSKKRSSCSVGGGLLGFEERTPSQLATPLDPAILASFAVLRRPQAPSDLIPPLSNVGALIDYELSGFYPTYIRRVATIKGASYYLIPVFLREHKIPPARCLPPSERRDRSKYVELERKRASSPAYCIVRVGGTGGPEPGRCEPFDAVNSAARAFAGSVFSTPMVELAPDGVNAVRVSFATAPPIVVPTSESVYTFSPPKGVLTRLKHLFKGLLFPAAERHLSKRQRHRREIRLQRAFEKLTREAEPTKIEWLGPGGALVRLVRRPRSPSLIGGSVVISG